MKQLGMKSLGILLVLAALCAGVSSRAYAFRIAASPDSLTMSTAIGTSTNAEVYIMHTDSADTSAGINTETIHMYLTGSSQFSLVSDSVLQFIGATNVTVRFSPTSSGVSYAMLKIVSDSNTLYVTLTGIPLTHIAPVILTSDYNNMEPNQETCHPFELYNTNADTIRVTSVTLTNLGGTGWSINNLVSLPITLAGHETDTLGQVCATISPTDSFVQCHLNVDYSYAVGTDSTSVNIMGTHRSLSSTCVTTSGGDFGSVTPGTSETKTITLINTTDSSIYLYSPEIAYGDTGAFTINGSSFPVALAPNDSLKVSIAFAAPSQITQDNYNADFVCSVEGLSRDNIPCSAVDVWLSASVTIPIVDSITLDVPPDSATLSISAHTDRSRHAIFIHNTGTSQLTVESISISSADTGFAFFDRSGNLVTYLSDSIAASGTAGPVFLTLEAPDTGTHSIDLTITYTISGTHKKSDIPMSNSVTYTVVAHRLPAITEGVSEPNAPSQVDFTLSPNPARDEVTIGLPSEGISIIEIYDVLGNLLVHRAAQGSFIWNGLVNGASLTNGTYIVRVSNGSKTSSKELIIVH